LVAETISCAVQKDPTVDGFDLPDGQRVKLFQYADDTSVFVHSDHALLSLFSLFERYEKASGAKLNIAKSHGLLFGSWRDRVHMPIPLNWCNDAITVLGCRLSNDNQVDWNSLVEHFAGQLLLWKQRQLSFCGRAMIANTLGLSIFWYQATLFDIPKTVVFRINKSMFPFMWDKKREWMARSSVTQSLAQGGLGVVDVERKLLSLRAVWFRRYSSPHPWWVFFYFYVSLHFGQPVPEVLARVI
jgi:hypothetical protein